MLVFGDYNCLTEDIVSNINNLCIFNLNSFIEGYERLNLIPPFVKYDDKDFDIMYAKYIIDNDVPFMELMKVIMSLYYGGNVYILSTINGVYEYVAESLQKFIQQRYGLISYTINDIEDWDYVENTAFNIYGVYNLDKDKERYSYIYASMNMDKLK